MRRLNHLTVLLSIVLGQLLLAPASWAHTSVTGRATLRVSDSGKLEARLVVDIIDMLDHAGPNAPKSDSLFMFADILTKEQQKSSLARLHKLFGTLFEVVVDGKSIPLRTTLPGIRQILKSAKSATGRLMVVAGYTGRIPKESKQLRIRNGNLLGLVRFEVSIKSETNELLLSENQTSIEIDLTAAPGKSATKGTPGRLQVAWQYLVLGFEHILPKGLDHILFVLGLFLLSTHLKPLLWQVTAFTIAHSVTLALAMYGVVSVPSSIVEPLIALSIAYVAIENVVVAELKPWRIAVVFGFGLLHGLGFAGVLTDLGLPRSRFVTALLTFNLGVELGQLAVIGLAYLAVNWFYEKEWYHRRIVITSSAIIATVGCLWAVERIADIKFLPI